MKEKSTCQKTTTETCKGILGIDQISEEIIYMLNDRL